MNWRQSRDIFAGSWGREVFSVRWAWSKPLLASSVVATVAVGICSSLTIFSVVSAALLRALPYPNAARSVVLSGRISLADAESYRAGTAGFSALSTFWPMQETVELPSRVASVRTTFASPEFFQVFAVRPLVGRGPHSAADAMLSHRLWTSEFGADPQVLGKVVRLQAKMYRVAGVMPLEFRYPDRTDLWLPLESWDRDARLKDRGGRYLLSAGLLADGWTLRQAQSALDAISIRLAQVFPQTNSGVRPQVLSLRQSEVGEVRPYLMLAFALLACFLAICSGNVACLMAARYASRRQELAIRLALGASRCALLKQMMSDSFILCVVGGVIGSFGALQAMHVVGDQVVPHLPEWVRNEADWRMFGFGAGLIVFISLLSGLPSAWRSLRPAAAEDLRTGGRQRTHGSITLQRFIVAGQVALSFTMLVAAMLLSRSFLNLVGVDTGLRTSHIVVAHIVPYETTGSNASSGERLSRVIAGLKWLPGVVAVGGTNILPFTRDAGMRSDSDHLRGVLIGTVAPDYFASMGIPLLRGRVFNDHDDATAPPVVVVSKRLADALWRGEDPVGQRFSIGDRENTVVGVVGDVKYSPIETEGSEVYLPYRQAPPGHFHLTVRTEQDAHTMFNAINGTIASVDRGLAVTSVQTMDSIKQYFLWRQRLCGFLAIAASGAAAILAVVGVFGLIAFVTRERTFEIGVRAALGATPLHSAIAVVADCLRLIGAGLTAGLPASVAINRSMEGFLFGVTPGDVRSYLSCAGLLALLAVLACAVPAAAAARVDPAVALRSE